MSDKEKINLLIRRRIKRLKAELKHYEKLKFTYAFYQGGIWALNTILKEFNDEDN